MILSDGECPICFHFQLSLNTRDLLECPNCGLVCAVLYPAIATVMPFRGDGHFRLEDTEIAALARTEFAKSKNGSVIPESVTFETRSQLNDYLNSLKNPKNNKDHILLKSFISSFKKFITQTNRFEIESSWRSKSARTSLYCNIIMPFIAKDMSLIYEKEKFTIDYILSKQSYCEINIPLVAIESENDYNSATHEVKKLCLVNTPLKVLITAPEKLFIKKAGAGAYGKVREWQSIIRCYSQQNPCFSGMFLIIFGRFDGDSVDYQYLAFHANGDLALPLLNFQGATI
jgi:hypothetical protein